MNFTDFKAAIQEEAVRQGIEDYELYYQASESVSVSAFKHEINEFSSAQDGGVCFRCLVNGRMGYASTEELSPEQARRVVSQAADNARSLETDEKEFLGEGGKTYRQVRSEDWALPETDRLIGLALAGQDALYGADEAVVDGSTTSAEMMTSKTAIVNSRGLDLSSEGKVLALVVSAVVSGGEEKSSSFEIKLGSPEQLNIGEVAQKAVKEAKDKLGADVAPTGSYPVVFAPKAMASLLATYSSIFSSEAARKGLSKLAGLEGQKIASDLVTLTDDPFYAESPMPMAFDAEGTPTFTKNVIEGGQLKTLLYNLKSAAAAGKETTGNASKAGYNAKVDIRPFTLLLNPGQLSEEELLAKAGNGVYIDTLGGLHAGANVISGDFSLQSSGFMIENGVKTQAVKSFTVAGNFYELLKNITGLSDRAELRNMGGITGFASPSVLVEGLSVAGK